MTPERVQARGLSLRLWRWGPPEGRPVLLLHGFLDQALGWARVAERLAAAGRRVLAPDQRGHGASDRVHEGGWYHFPDYVADLDALVDGLGVERFDLVGHSMGGTVAGWYAGVRPERVHRLALVEGMGPMAPAEDSALERLRQYLDGRRNPPRVPALHDEAQAAERLLRRHPGLEPEHAALLAREGTARGPDGLQRWTFDRQHLVRAAVPFREAWFGEALAAITAPTLVVWGAQGWYAPEVQARRVARLRAPVRVETLPGGHMLPYDQAPALALLLLEHLGPAGAAESAAPGGG